MMTRREYELISKTINQAQLASDAKRDQPMVTPSAEYMRCRLAGMLCAALGLKNDAARLFLKQAGVLPLR